MTWSKHDKKSTVKAIYTTSVVLDSFMWGTDRNCNS